MTTQPFGLHAVVDPAEQAGVLAAARLLSGALGRASSARPVPFRVSFAPPGSLAVPEGTTALLLSLLPEAGADAPIEQSFARWRNDLHKLRRPGLAILIATVFRHVRERAPDGGISATAERIRRLNRMAIELSHAMEIGVIDVDRSFSYIGADALDTDYRLAGQGAADALAHVIAWSFMSYDIDGLAPDIQERAKAALGGPEDFALHVLNAAAQRRGVSLAR